MGGVLGGSIYQCALPSGAFDIFHGDIVWVQIGSDNILLAGNSSGASICATTAKVVITLSTFNETGEGHMDNASTVGEFSWLQTGVCNI